MGTFQLSLYGPCRFLPTLVQIDAKGPTIPGSIAIMLIHSPYKASQNVRFPQDKHQGPWPYMVFMDVPKTVTSVTLTKYCIPMLAFVQFTETS